MRGAYGVIGARRSAPTGTIDPHRVEVTRSDLRPYHRSHTSGHQSLKHLLCEPLCKHTSMTNVTLPTISIHVTHPFANYPHLICVIFFFCDTLNNNKQVYHCMRFLYGICMFHIFCIDGFTINKKYLTELQIML